MLDDLPADLPADRLVHPAVRAVGRVAVGFTALPVVAAYAGGQWLWGIAHRAAARLPDVPEDVGTIPPALPPVASVAEAVGRVAAITSAVSPRPNWALVRSGFPDWPLMVATAKPQFALVGYRYPRRFRPRVFPGADGEPIAAVVGRQRTPRRPAVIVAHGAMTTTHFDYVRRTCLRFHRAGYHVLAPDLRGSGLTALTTAAPQALGWKEGEDIVAAAEYLRDGGATSVAAVGFSLGATAVLNAARHSRPGYGVDGGVLALAPPTDLADILRHVSTRPPLRHRFFGTWLTLRTVAISQARAAGYTYDTFSPEEGFARFAAPFYHLDAAEIARRASPLGWIGEVRVPVLVLHACDDVVVPVDHAERLRAAAAGNPFVHVLVRATGAHHQFHAMDPAWMEGVEAAWLGSFARWETGDAPAADRAPPRFASRTNPLKELADTPI